MKFRSLTCVLCVLVILLGWLGTGFAGRAVDWGTINPNLKGVPPVSKSAECMDCHEDYIKSFLKTKHARHYRTKLKIIGARSCEACHGPLSKHLQEQDFDKKLKWVVSFKKITPAQRNKICLQCHEKGERLHWRGSTHEMLNVSCDKCHYVMQRKSRKFLSISEDSKKACFQCHQDKRARMFRSAHMPLREGKMGCADCHNPHGGTGPSMLKAASVNDTCYICHQEKRGPLLWEHAPVRENCSNCHEPHGSNHLSMLKQKVPYLCQSCHVSAFHPSTLYDGQQLPGGGGTSQRDFLGKSCLNCHSLIHGSNHPSGSHFQR